MTQAYTAQETSAEGYPAVELIASEAQIRAVFCPTLGMIGCSLEHAGQELLGQRDGLARYEATGSTMGIPLLHPWANRLSGFSYSAAGRQVELDRGSPLIHLDPNGLPIHGVAAASPYWDDVRMQDNDNAARLSARLDFGAHPELLECFPFPHELRMDVALEGNSLTITTRLSPTGEAGVPVSFGFHPYFELPDVARAEWKIEAPPARRLVLDEHMIPTGETEPAQVGTGALGDRTFDDGFCDLPERPVFVLEGGGRRIEVEFLEGYPYAQVYAPADPEVVCYEPMTAATNALVAGGSSLTVAAPGSTYEAAFRIAVAAAR